MKSLIALLSIVGLSSPTIVNTMVMANNESIKKVNTQKIEIKLITQDFEVDENGKPISNKYDMSQNFMTEWEEWVDFRDKNNILEFEIENINAKFEALDSGGANINKDIYKKILLAKELKVSNLIFNLKETSENDLYTFQLLGDFVIDGVEYQQVNLSGYDQNQQFNQSQILSNFVISTEVELINITWIKRDGLTTIDTDPDSRLIFDTGTMVNDFQTWAIANEDTVDLYTLKVELYVEDVVTKTTISFDISTIFVTDFYKWTYGVPVDSLSIIFTDNSSFPEEPERYHILASILFKDWVPAGGNHLVGNHNNDNFYSENAQVSLKLTYKEKAI